MITASIAQSVSSTVDLCHQVDREITNQTDIIDEGIRQRCIWNFDPEFFMDYIFHYDKMCLSYSNSLEDVNITGCAKKAFESAKISTEKTSFYDWDNVTQCFEESFIAPTNKIGSAVTVLGNQQKAEGVMSNFEVIPALAIEDYLVRGNLDPISLASSICDSLLKPPATVCSNLPELIDEIERKAVDPYNKNISQPMTLISNEEQVTFLQMLIGGAVLVGSLALIAGCGYLAKKLLDKNLYRHINTEVEQNVHNYIRMRNEENQTKEKPAPAIVDI